MNYAILDVETTGGKFNEEGIIEIAVYRFDGEKITDTFISLINPEKEIHFFVQKLTGITQKMIKTAPKFHEVAKRLVEITDDATIVAHNVNFDYRVIKSEFKKLGFNFERPTLDTVTLSKALLPNLNSYSLGKLCTSLGIPVSDRHRAHGDARATVKLFQLLLSKDSQKNIIKSSIKKVSYNSLNNKIIKLLENIPQSSGVFYLYNEKGTIIYIDHSNNIANKVRQVLTGKSTKSRNLQSQSQNISFELTGNDIIAYIKCLHEVRINKPKYRYTKEKKSNNYGIFLNKINNKLFTEVITKENMRNILVSFSSLKNALLFLDKLPKSDSFKDYFSINEEHLLLTGKGRNIGEKSFLFLEKGNLIGYGFYSLHSQIKNIERIYKIMTIILKNDPEVNLLIRNKLFISKKLKKIIVQ